MPWKAFDIIFHFESLNAVALSQGKRRVRLAENPIDDSEHKSSEGNDKVQGAGIAQTEDDIEETNERTPLTTVPQDPLLCKDVRVINELIDDLTKLEPSAAEKVPLRSNFPSRGTRGATDPHKKLPMGQHETRLNANRTPPISMAISRSPSGNGRKRGSLGSNTSSRNLNDSSLALDTPGITEQVQSFTM